MNQLAGWVGSGMADRVYGSGLQIATLESEIAKVKYHGLDLSHL